MELLFDNKRSHRVSIPAYIPDESSTSPPDPPPSSAPGRAKTNVSYLIHWMRDNLLKERVELFMEGDTVCVYP